MADAETVRPTVSVIIPARNEEACLGHCLQSVLTQAGVDFEVIVVDDHSSDSTAEIAASFVGVRLVEADPLPRGWSGKNNAVATGAGYARGSWLLFTDADTVHLPGSLAHSLQEAESRGASLLSYSPEQIVVGFWEKAVMPVIFSELASSYRPTEVSDPHSSAAAANGQYMLVTREAYDAVGGHAAVAGSLLEDVALARAIKGSGRKIFFRFGGDVVRTRMYRNFLQLREGWTKNLALLFPHARWLAAWRGLEFVLLVFCLTFAVRSIAEEQYVRLVLYSALPMFSFLRIRRAHFSWRANLLALFGLPMFSYLLIRSSLHHRAGVVAWKGRTYDGSKPAQEIEPERETIERAS